MGGPKQGFVFDDEFAFLSLGLFFGRGGHVCVHVRSAATPHIQGAVVGIQAVLAGVPSQLLSSTLPPISCFAPVLHAPPPCPARVCAWDNPVDGAAGGAN